MIANTSGQDEFVVKKKTKLSSRSVGVLLGLVVMSVIA